VDPAVVEALRTGLQADLVRAGIGVHRDRRCSFGEYWAPDAGQHLLDFVLESGVDRQLHGPSRPRLV
jgi:hypothetical protein